MNANCYKIIFSKHLGTLVAVGEHTCAAGKAASGQACRASHLLADAFVGILRFSFASVALACLTLNNTQAQQALPTLATTALPQGGTVNTGSATMSTNGAAMAITQSTDKASINWQSFNVGTGASVNITQPSASAVLLNRVVGNDPSQILGQLKANGQVILLNPNGVVFGKDGSVTASSFTASTFGLTDADFMAGYYKYNRNGSTAAVVNQGTIETSAGGFVALIGATVTNEGTIRAPKGDVVLVAAESVTLPTDLTQPQAPATPNTVSVRMSKRVRLELDPGAINTAVNNTESGVIVTEGGQVLLQAAAISSAVASVTHSGRIDTSAPQAGAVTVLADNGVIKVDGSITANSNGTDNQGQTRKGADIIIGRDEETGVLAHFTDVSGAKLESNQGFVETSGDVLATTGTRVKASEWLLDPNNITIQASGATGTAYASNYTSGADSIILASDISANLTAGTSVTLATGAGGASVGNIAVNESIAKTGGGDATLTLQAHGNITVAASKTITSNTGKLNVVFNSDSDATSGGAIVFNTGSGITSNGGNITLGGGSGLAGADFAIADGVSTLQGISLNTATITAGGGNISMKGKTAVTNYLGSLSNISGIYMAGGSISTTGSGTISLTGNNQNTDTQSQGFVLSSGTITGGSTGAVTITGDSRGVTSSTFTYVRGALMNGTVTSTGGNIGITGYGGAGVQYDYGVDVGGSVTTTGAGTVSITGTAGAGGSGGNVGVNTSGSGTISSVDGAIAITGTGGIGNGSQIRDHGVVISGTNAIRSTGGGDLTVTGTATNSDNGFSQGVVISTGGLSTNTGNIKVDARVPQNYQVAASITSAIAATSGNVYVRSAGGKITNSSTGTISGNNVSIENTNGSIDANGVITIGAGGASSWSGVISQIGIDLGGSVTATNNLNIYGNQTGFDAGVKMSGATTTVSGKNITLYGKSSTANGVLLSGSILSGQYINATGATNTGTAGFAWQGGNINTTGTTGTSTASVVKGTSAASGNTNGFGAFMMIANSATNAANGTSLTFAGESTTLAAGVNTNERGILVQGGYTLAASGDITFDGSSKSSEGIAFGGTINTATVAGVTNKITIKGTAAASSNNSWNAINFSGAINGNAATSSINFLGDAKNLSGANKDNAVNISGAITGNAANINIQSTGATIVTSAAITGANISIDNTNGTINSGTGAITTSTGTAASATGISIGGNVTATGNLNLSGVSSGGTGINFVAAKAISGANIQATGKTTNGVYGVLFNGTNTVATTGTSGDSQIKGMTTAGGTNALLAWGGLTLTSANGTTLTLWGDGTNTSDRAARFDGGGTTTGAVTLKGTSNNATALMFINGAITANANSALTLSGVTSGSAQSGVYFVNSGGVSLSNGATLNVTGQNTNATGAGSGVSIAGAGITKAAGATSAGAVSITGLTSSASGSTGVDAPSGVATDGNIVIQGTVASSSSTGVNIAGAVTSSGSATTINISSNYAITSSGAISVSGATGTGASINLSSTNAGISGLGTIGSTTNKNESVTFTQAGTSTYDGAINAANFTKAGAGALTLDSWVQTPSVATNISNAYTVKDGGSLTLSPGATYAQLNPVSVNVENASTFAISSSGNGWWKGTAFNFTGASGGGTLNLGGNPIGASGFTNTFSTNGGATNTVTGLLNTNSGNVNFSLANATSGTALLDGSFAAIAFTQSAQGGYGLQNATTINMSGGGNLLFKDKVGAATFNINAGNVQVGDGSAATSSATATLDATSVSIAAGSKLTFDRAEAYSNASAITGAGSLIQAGAGTLTLTGNSNAFAGATTVNAGKTLAIGTGGSLGAAGSSLVLADSAASLLFTEATGTTSIVGSTISGAGSLSHTGAGTGVLAADNSYSGATTVSGGTLQIGNATTTGTLGTANAVTLSNNATLAFKRSANTTINKTISGVGKVTADITGDLVLTSNIALTGASAIDLKASGSITETAGSLAATNLYMTATAGSIGTSLQRIQSNVDNLSVSAGGDVFLTEANAVTVAGKTTANNGNINIATTNGTMTIGSVNNIAGITANGTGNITLSGTTDTGHGIYIGNNITASNGTVSITGTTSTAANPDAGVRSAGTVTAKNITMLASATNVGGGALGYFGAGGYFNATEQLNLTGTTAGTANGFYSYTGGFSSGTGTTIIGTSTSGQGVGLDNGITMTNGSTGNISIIGTATDGTKQGIGLRGIAITNGGGNTVLTAVNGVIATDSGNPAWNTGLQTNTITSNGTGSVQVVAGNSNAANAASIDGTVFSITQSSNAGVLVSTSGTGNVTAPKVTNNGTGNVVVAAGSAIAAGTGTGGQVLTVAGNNITQNSTGKTYIYTGAASGTGDLSNLISPSFDTLYYEGTSHTLNAAFSSAYNSTIANGANAQVLFREASTPSFTLTLPSAQVSKIYGQADPTLANLRTAVQTAYTSASGATTLTTDVNAAGGGSNTFGLSASEAIAALTGTRAAGENVNGGTPYAYSLTVSSLNTNVAGSAPTLLINKAALTSLTGAKTYDGQTASLQAGSNGSLTITGVNGETATLDSGTSVGLRSANAGTSSVSSFNTATFTSANHLDMANYLVTDAALQAITTANAANNSVAIGKANLTGISGSKTYDGQSALTVGTSGGLLSLSGVNGETASIATGSVTLSGKDVATNGQTVSAITALGLATSAGATLDLNNYDLAHTPVAGINNANNKIDIGKKDVTLASITAANKTYDGTNAATITSGNIATGVGAETLAISGTGTFADGYAADGKTVTVADVTHLIKADGTGTWSNYNLSSTGSLTTQANIAKANLTVTASQVIKTYDGGLSATGTGTVGALAGAGDTIDTAGTQIFVGSSDAGTGKTVRASGLVIKNGSNPFMNDNYNITYVDNTTSVINKATLTVTANADAKFVTQPDTTNYKGVNYSGFVAGQNSAVLGGTLAISRTNSVTDLQPGSYAGSLVPTGLTSNNYDFQYVNGNYTILPAAKLLVTTTNQTVTYGTAPTYTTTAEYLDNHNQVISMLSVAGYSNNQYTFTDGVGGTATLALKPYTGTNVAAQSASGNTVVGNYNIQDLGFTQTGNNFNGTPVFLGTLTVAQKGITPNLSGVSKVYDGSSAMGSLSVQMAGMVPNDALSISGTGAFNQKNVGTSLGYTVTGISLSGNDASNYYLVGATNTYSGTDGVITAKALTLTGSTVANKTFDGNTNATVTTQGTLTGLVGNETVTLTGLTGAFDTAAVGTQKTVALSSSLGNGLNGGLASNYSLAAGTAYADITAANNNGGNGGNGGNGSSTSNFTAIPKPIIPTDNSSEGGGGSGGGSSAGNPYLVLPNNRPNSADRCTPNTLEDCVCETQEARPVEGLAICYQPKKTASTTPAKARRG